MSEIYRSQFRMPFKLFEKLKAEAGKSGRSVNAELVGRLERSLTESSNELDIKIIFEALERLSLRNPDLRYSFGVQLGQTVESASEISGGSWTLPANSSSTFSASMQQETSERQGGDKPKS
ncbi:Arc family DNA-binding protein [Oxalobacteraceae bacterium A2-2]